MKNSQTLAALAFAIAVVIAGASSLRAGGERKKPVKSEDVTPVGKFLDLQSFIAGKFTGNDPPSRHPGMHPTRRPNSDGDRVRADTAYGAKDSSPPSTLRAPT